MNDPSHNGHASQDQARDGAQVSQHLDEQAVLGAILWGANPEPAIALLGSDSFHDPRHSLLWAHLTAAWSADQPTDPISIAGQLREHGDLKTVGGLANLHAIYHTGSIATASIGHYASRVADAADGRALAELAARLASYTDIDDPARRRELADAAMAAHAARHASPNGHQNQAVDWAQLLEKPPDAPAWLAGKLLCHGQQAALVGEGKAGKSILAHEWAWRAAAGLPFLGDVARDPVRVLYIDQENTLAEIADRMRSFGANPVQLANLVYLSFPTLPALNTAAGASALLHLVQVHQPGLLFLDTISRMVEGEENDAPTWLNLYRLTLAPLKAAEVACVRLDHFGKDTSRGARGSSAKTQDVDHVWELAVTGQDGLLGLTRTHSRTGVGTDLYTLRRLAQRTPLGWAAGATRHVLTDPGWSPPPAEVISIAARLDALGLSPHATRQAVRVACAQLGIKARNETIAQVMRLRRTQADSSG